MIKYGLSITDLPLFFLYRLCNPQRLLLGFDFSLLCLWYLTDLMYWRAKVRNGIFVLYIVIFTLNLIDASCFIMIFFILT
jgi:hypothetical protein